MRRITPRSYCLTAGLLVLLGGGCQQGPSPRHDQRLLAAVKAATPPAGLPGGRTPDSYRVRAAVPAPQDGLLRVRYERPTAAQPAPPLVLTCPLPAAGLAHASDYRWLVGHLLHDPARHRWSVRYAGADEADCYGGLLELVNPGPMDGFSHGQLVRAEGELVDPAPHELKPAYRARTLRALPR